MGFKIGDLVWAKMKGFPSWPAKIADPNSSVKAPKNINAYEFVQFFGTGDVAWIMEKNIIPHSEAALDQIIKKRSKLYQCAIDDLMNYPGTIKKKKQSSLKIKENVQRKEINNSRQSVERDNQCLDICTQSTSSMVDATEKPSVQLKNFGFIGLDDVGKSIIKKMLESGMNVTLWDEIVDRCTEFTEMYKGTKIADSPAALIVNCDITFCCCDSGTDYFKDIIFGEDGILKGFEEAAKLGQNHKGYVGLTSIEYKTSVEINEAISVKNGFYLEAPVIGSMEDATEDKLVVVASGNRNLFTDCEEFFQRIAIKSVFINCDVGSSSKISVVLNAVSATVLAAMAEGVKLSERLNIYKGDVCEVINSLVKHDSIKDKVLRMSRREYMKPVTPLKHVQKDMSFALNLVDTSSVSMPVNSAANEVYKHAKLLKYSESDVTSIYKIIKY